MFDVLYSKQAFLKNENVGVKMHKIGMFPKVHGVGQNFYFFFRFVLCKIHPEKVFGDVVVRKQAFLHNINMYFKKGQNWHFCKGDSP